MRFTHDEEFTLSEELFFWASNTKNSDTSRSNRGQCSLKPTLWAEIGWSRIMRTPSFGVHVAMYKYEYCVELSASGPISLGGNTRSSGLWYAIYSRAPRVPFFLQEIAATTSPRMTAVERAAPLELTL